MFPLVSARIKSLLIRQYPPDSEGDLKFKYIKMMAIFRQEQVQMSLFPSFSVIIFQFSLIDSGFSCQSRYQHDY